VERDLKVKTDVTDEEIVKYLLGTIADERQTLLEERLFADDELHERLQVIEAELAEAYVRGELAGDDRDRFARQVETSTRLRERVEFMQALVRAVPAYAVARMPKVSNWRAPAGRLWTVGLAAAAALVVALGALWFSRSQFSPPEPVAQHDPLVQPSPEPPRPPSEGSPAPPEDTRPAEPPSKPRPSVVALTLAPAAVRGGDANTLQLEPSVRQVRLQMKLAAAESATYDVRIVTVDGNEVWRRSGLTARGTNVTADVPASVFAKRDYLVTVSGVDASGKQVDVSEYALRVERLRQDR
jgi:hypothetical protein